MTRASVTAPDTWLTDNLPDVGDLVGSAEIQKLLGVNRQRVDQFAREERYAFPEPVAVLKAGKIWRTEDVVAWARARGREVQAEGEES